MRVLRRPIFVCLSNQTYSRWEAAASDRGHTNEQDPSQNARARARTSRNERDWRWGFTGITLAAMRKGNMVNLRERGLGFGR